MLFLPCAFEELTDKPTNATRIPKFKNTFLSVFIIQSPFIFRGQNQNAAFPFSK